MYGLVRIMAPVRKRIVVMVVFVPSSSLDHYVRRSVVIQRWSALAMVFAIPTSTKVSQLIYTPTVSVCVRMVTVGLTAKLTSTSVSWKVEMKLVVCFIALTRWGGMSVIIAFKISARMEPVVIPSMPRYQQKSSAFVQLPTVEHYVTLSSVLILL
jgi:hypothetical protein